MSGRRALLAGLAILLLGSGPCGKKEDPCAPLRAAPAAIDSAPAAELERIWRDLRTPYDRFWGWPTSFRVLSPEVRLAGRSLPPQAVTCAGPEPAVFAAAALADRLAGAGRPERAADLAAFILAHELGHRVADLDAAGARRPASARSAEIAAERIAAPSRADAIEALADKRAAFMMALAGYSPSSLARGDLVDAFLAAEFRVPPDRRAPRKVQLLAALARFEDYEWLYQLGTGLAFAGAFDAARPLLDWADLLVQGRDVPLPELRVARAVARIVEAAAGAMRRRPDLAARRCELVHPGASSLVDPVRRTARGATPDDRALLLEALALLGEAEALGANPLVVSAARGCAHAYLGDLAAARAQIDAALRLAAGGPSAPLEALQRNLALVSALDGSAHQGGAASAPPLAAPPCGGTPPALAELSDLAASAGARGCPRGWREVRRVDAPAAPAAGATACRRDGPETVQLAILRVPREDAPARVIAAIELRGPDVPALAAWRCACEDLLPQGASDRGESAWQARCPGGGAALFASSDGTVRHAIFVPEPRD